MPNLIKHLTGEEKNNLFDALNYMKMKEIKNFCKNHVIPTKGQKGEILKRIKHFLTTGDILLPLVMPEKSKSKKGVQYPLHPDTHILYGAYKNDLKTRTFFKKLIGDHFHFTAFGQDWIADRWQKGRPPTYAEFAKAWQNEYLKRAKSEANPKQEWAYLNFVRRFQKENPGASKTDVAKGWEKTRKQQVKRAKLILDKIKT